MGGKGNQPRNALGQYASYDKGAPSHIGVSAAASSKKQKVVIHLELDSEDVEVARGKRKSGAKTTCGSSAVHGFGKVPAIGGPAEIFDESSDDMEINSDTSDDVEGLIDEVSDVFVEAKKKMCDDGIADPVKADEFLDWLFEGVVGAGVALRSKKAKQALKKRFGKKPPQQ